MKLNSFIALKEGIIKAIEKQSNKAFQGTPDAKPEFLQDMDVLAFDIDGVAVMLLYYQALKDDRAFIMTDFGALPPEAELAAMRKLFEVNFLMYRGGAPVFCRSPDSGNITLLGEIPLSSATPESVLTYMRELSDQARQWRTNYYLEETPAAGASLPVSLA